MKKKQGRLMIIRWIHLKLKYDLKYLILINYKNIEIVWWGINQFYRRADLLKIVIKIINKNHPFIFRIFKLYLVNYYNLTRYTFLLNERMNSLKIVIISRKYLGCVNEYNKSIDSNDHPFHVLLMNLTLKKIKS